MGKFLEKFKKGAENAQRSANYIDNRANKYAQDRRERPREMMGGKIRENPQKIRDDFYDGADDFNDDFGNDFRGNFKDDYDSVGIQPAQKPESFHHFILENQYKDLEKSIRGYKDVFNKDKQTWEVKRKTEHCFTDEEAEEILRTAQSYLATDIKLSFINKEVFGEQMMAIYKVLEQLFWDIAEYRYGRYGDYETQYKMKLQNLKIFQELWVRVQANFSRAIQGQENKATHMGVQGQESLQQTDRFEDRNRRYS